MAVCLATTTGDEVDNDDIVELVREDDEVELLNRAVTTSYSPLSFHVYGLTSNVGLTQD